MGKSTLRICKNGHRYYKSSDCPTCPKCEDEKKPTSGFLSEISAPARRGLASKNVTTLKKLSAFSEEEILKLHGVGPSAIPILKKALEGAGLTFKK